MHAVRQRQRRPGLTAHAKKEQLDEIRRSRGRSDALKIAKKGIQIRDLVEELEKELKKAGPMAAPTEANCPGEECRRKLCNRPVL